MGWVSADRIIEIVIVVVGLLLVGSRPLTRFTARFRPARGAGPGTSRRYWVICGLVFAGFGLLLLLGQGIAAYLVLILWAVLGFLSIGRRMDGHREGE